MLNRDLLNQRIIKLLDYLEVNENERLEVMRFITLIENIQFNNISGLAKTLRVPVSYFYTEDNGEAELILKYKIIKDKNPNKRIKYDFGSNDLCLDD